MNRDDLYIGFNEVDDDILERSEEATQRKRSFTWLKWTRMMSMRLWNWSLRIRLLRSSA